MVWAVAWRSDKRGHKSRPGSSSCRGPPPYRLLRPQLACLRSGKRLGWSGPMSARYDPGIRLHHTGRTIMARFKYDTKLQHLARWVGSTCHDGLLASEVWGIDWRAPRGAEHPETHPRARDAVVYAECSSRTLAPGLQLCKECNHSSLWRASVRRRVEAHFDDSGFEPLAQCGGEYRQCGQ